MTRLTMLVLMVALQSGPPAVLPAEAVAQLAKSLADAGAPGGHPWRDRPPMTSEGLVNGFVEISRGDRRKFELDIATRQLRLDRVVSPAAGAFPVNYGIVPQTVSYDGDPFDILLLGPPVKEGTAITGVVVGLFRMEDEKGPDAKVVLSPAGASGQPAYRLDAAARRRIERFFTNYKKGQPGRFSRVSGWGDAAEGRAFVERTHAFYTSCAAARGECRVGQ